MYHACFRFHSTHSPPPYLQLIDRIVDNPLENKAVRTPIAVAGLNSYFKMLLHDNLVHADLHPGAWCSHICHISWFSIKKETAYEKVSVENFVENL